MTCRVRGCKADRAPDALVCRDHLTDLWCCRLARQPDGTYVALNLPQPRWLTWTAEHENAKEVAA